PPWAGSTRVAPPFTVVTNVRPVRSTVPEVVATTSPPTCSRVMIVAAPEREQSRNKAPIAQASGLLLTLLTMLRLFNISTSTFAEWIRIKPDIHPDGPAVPGCDEIVRNPGRHRKTTAVRDQSRASMWRHIRGPRGSSRMRAVHSAARETPGR